ncbi:hypothetical protein D083_3755 [Dickeya solani RNS 08.23.3.1.A]|nr:hypothetical protein D083_3755 [Dickeya solani RNS 08.23.3.1.A]
MFIGIMLNSGDYIGIYGKYILSYFEIIIIIMYRRRFSVAILSLLFFCFRNKWIAVDFQS